VACTLPGELASNLSPNKRAPVPQSSITVAPLESVSSMHDVLPPNRLVLGPGVAIDPRVPQKRTFMLSRLSTRAGRSSRPRKDRHSTIASIVSGAFPSSRLLTKMYDGSWRFRAREIKLRKASRTSGLRS
jgi:hypothetical protein